MNAVMLCPGCGTQNPVSRAFCFKCRTSLERGRPVSGNEARQVTKTRADRALKLRFRNYALLALVIVAVATWVSYIAYDFLNLPDSPSTRISVESASGDWPMYQRDPTHSGFTPDASFNPEGKIHWIFETDGQIASTPVVVEGAVYLSTDNEVDRTILALDAETGRLFWERSTSAPIDSSFVVAGGLVFVTTRDGRLRALNTSDGTIHWEFASGAPLYGSPTVYRGTVYIGTFHKKLFALDAATGRLLWDRTVGGRVTANLVVNDQIIAFNAQDNFIYILDARRGNQRLEFRTSQALGSVALNGERVYIADIKGGLRAIDWTKKHLPLEEKIRAIRSNLYALGLIRNFPIRKGSVWNVRQPNEPFLGTPAVANGMVYVSSESGKVFKVEESDGKPVWTFDAGAPTSKTVSVTPHYVLVGDAKGRVHIIDADTGEPAEQFEVDGPITSAPIVANDMLYVATGNGKLYAIK